MPRIAPVLRQAGRIGRLLRQAEVGDVRLAVLVEQDVRRLEVAVQHAARVGEMNRPRDRRQQWAASRGGSGPSASRWASVVPATCFMLKYGRPSSSPTSYTGTMSG